MTREELELLHCAKEECEATRCRLARFALEQLDQIALKDRLLREAAAMNTKLKEGEDANGDEDGQV